jgi:LCP family protein required for cell wall assembly
MAQRRRRAGLKARRGTASWGPGAPPANSVNFAAATPGGPPRRRWPWILLAVLLVLMVPVGYFGFNIVSTLFTISPGGNGPIAALDPGQFDAPAGTTYVLAMGSDERRDKNGNVAGGDVPHSDTMILVAVDTTNKKARMLSVPRDLLVSIPGYGSNHRINEAYTIGETQHVSGGGPALAVRTMEQLTGIHIPYYAVTTFDGFRQTVDAVGGVQIDVERPITDHQYPGQTTDYMPVYVPAGPQLLDGERALEYVRSRHDDPLSDFGRNQRQQRFIDALARKMLQPERVTQFNQFMDIVKSSVRTNLSPAQILGMGRTMISVGKGHVQGYAVGPGYVHDPTPGLAAVLGAVLVPDKTAMQQLFKAFEDGTPPPNPSPTVTAG